MNALHLFKRERDYYSTNLSILNISSYSDWNLFWDAKIFRKREIITLFKLQIPQYFRLFWSWSPNFILLLNSKNRKPCIYSLATILYRVTNIQRRIKPPRTILGSYPFGDLNILSSFMKIYELLWRFVKVHEDL